MILDFSDEGKSLLRKGIVVLQFLRFEKPLAAGAFTLVGVYLGSDLSQVLSLPALYAASAICLINAFSFVVNDLSDVVADQVNNPNRPIPLGLISHRSAVVLAILLGTGGLAVASRLGVQPFMFAFLLVILSVLYSYRLKGTPLFGSALVAMMIASILIYGALVGGHITPGVWVASAMTFLFVFSQEILVTIRDEIGDRTAGLRTVAVLFGSAHSLRVFKFTALITAFFCIMPWWLGVASKPYLLAATTCGVIPIVLTVVITRNGSTQAIHTAIVSMKYISIAAFVPILLLR